MGVFLFMYVLVITIITVNLKMQARFYLKNGVYMEVPIVSYAESRHSRPRSKNFTTYYHITVKIPDTEEILTLVSGVYKAGAYNTPGQLIPIYYVAADVVPPSDKYTRIRFASEVKDDKLFRMIYIIFGLGFLLFGFIFALELGVFS
jgi:hypothetical protein